MKFFTNDIEQILKSSEMEMSAICLRCEELDARGSRPSGLSTMVLVLPEIVH